MNREILGLIGIAFMLVMTPVAALIWAKKEYIDEQREHLKAQRGYLAVQSQRDQEAHEQRIANNRA